MSCITPTRSAEPGFFTAVVRLRCVGFGEAFPAARAPGFAVARDFFGAAFAAGASFCSAFAAALAALLAGRSRFELRFPGRELGRFPSTPPSSVMDGDSISARSGYTAPGGMVDTVREVSTG
jgi:hypothetical protein